MNPIRPLVVIGASAASLMAAIDVIELTIKGSSCHGAEPYKGIDTITITGQLISALQTISSRDVKTTKFMVLSFGKISGGRVFNVIPNSVELEGLVRTFSPEIRSYVKNRFEEIVSSIVKGLKGDYDLNDIQGYPSLINDPYYTDAFLTSVQKILSKDERIQLDEPVMVTEDMAYYLEKIPGVFFFWVPTILTKASSIRIIAVNSM